MAGLRTPGRFHWAPHNYHPWQPRNLRPKGCQTPLFPAFSMRVSMPSAEVKGNGSPIPQNQYYSASSVNISGHQNGVICFELASPLGGPPSQKNKTNTTHPKTRAKPKRPKIRVFARNAPNRNRNRRNPKPAAAPLRLSKRRRSRRAAPASRSARSSASARRKPLRIVKPKVGPPKKYIDRHVSSGLPSNLQSQLWFKVGPPIIIIMMMITIILIIW